MRYLNLLFNAALFLMPVAAMGQWTVVGSSPTVTTASVAYTKLVKDPAGNFYVSYSTGLTGGYVQKYNGTNWSVLGGGAATASSASFGSIGATTAGDIYYSFQDGGNGNKLSVRKYTSSTSTWADAGVAFSDYIINYQQLRIASATQLPVVSYYQALTSTGIFVKKYTGSAWVNVGAPATAIVSGSGGQHAMTLGTNDTVFVAVMIGANISVYKAPITATNASDWALVGTAGFTTGASSNQFAVSLAADQNNNLYMAYRAASANSSLVNVSKFNGSTWTALGTAVSTGNAEHISITVNAAGTPYVAYRDNVLGKAVVATYTGGSWQSLGVVSTTIGNYNDIILNNSGEPVVAFADGTGVSGGQVTVKKYTTPAVSIDSIRVATVGNVAATITSNAGTLPMQATVYPLTVSQAVTWSIVPVTGMATISSAGVITAQTNGTIWAKAVSVADITKKDSLLVTISNQVVTVDSVKVTTVGNVAATITTNAGTLPMQATVFPLTANQAVTWSIVPVTGMASISTAGVVTAQTNGTIWAKAVSVTNITKKDSLLVTITNQVVPVDSVKVTTVGNIAATITTNAGTLPMQAMVYPLNANQAVTWSIVPVTGTATISTAGVVTAQTNGTVWAKAVSVTNITKKDSLLITITNQVVPVDSVKVTTVGNIAATITTNAGTLPMQATVYPLTASQAVTWSIVPVTGTATISTAGVVTAQTNGTVWAKAVSVTNVAKKDSLLITITNQTVGIKHMKSETAGYKVYPNPALTYIAVELPTEHQEIQITLVDITGKIIKAGIADQTSANPYIMETAQLPKGCYLIYVTNDNLSFISKFTKE